MGDLKTPPQISTMRQASAEMRQLNRQFGMAGGGDAPWDQLSAFSAATRLISHKGGWCFEHYDLPLDRRR